MSKFSPAILAAAASQREVQLTTRGRVTGRPSRVTIWISPGDDGKLYIRSGAGLGRHWPQNFMARNEGTLHLAGHEEVPVRVRHVTDPAEARRVSLHVRQKYGEAVQQSTAGEPLTPGEEASFELLPGWASP